jgi:signal transduction histidine kinase
LTLTRRDDPSAAHEQDNIAALTRRLEAFGREIDSFGAALSHDLRAPLRSIEGFSRLLLKGHAQQLDSTGKEYLERIHRASLRLAGMMEDLLQLTRLARSGLKPQRVDLSAMAKEIFEALRGSAPQRQAELEVEPSLQVTGDARLLRLALESLLDNAWKFTARNAVAHISLRRAPDEGANALCVRDDGVGFDGQYADRLFRAFQRLHAQTEFEGNGLGLARVQRVVHAHGGLVWARSEPGKGAAFYFTLPGMEPPPAQCA